MALDQVTCGHPLHLQKMLQLLALLLLAPCVLQAAGTNGGVKVRVTQKGLEYGKEVGLERLKQMLKKGKIQDVSGSYNVPILGSVDYSITGIRVDELQVSNSTAAFSEGTGLSLAIGSAQVVLSGSWKVASVLGSDRGLLNISVRGLSVSTLLGVDRDGRGRPSVWCAQCDSGIEDFSLTFYGRTSWLYNTLASALRGTLKSEANRQICSEIRKGTDKLAWDLQTMDVLAQMDPFVGIDYSLVSKPLFGTDGCKVELKGEVFAMESSRRHPFLPAPFALPDQFDSMLVVGLTESVASSAAAAYFSAGALRVNFTDSMLKKRFPNMPMEVRVAARKQPLLSIHPEGVRAQVFGSAEASVILPNGSLASALLLDIDSNLTAQLFLEPVKSRNSIGKVSGSLVLEDFHLSQVWSSVGDIKGTFLDKILKMAVHLASA
ncbi:bactericidal permeability-increasing protein-like [Varanus komodoensis]|uniref:bactericidal permeability-increasing protein-like n=1 Tax=Varanus komodoensis TaxID=61221 RepID=UPI001CF7BEF5|nr:bactericidal permeability-increasing protein-like [Varanus komodoensis]